MTTNSKQVDYFSVNPNKKKIPFYMAFHTPFILTFQHVRFVFLWNRMVIYKQICDIFKSCDFFWEFLNTFEIFLKLACWV